MTTPPRIAILGATGAVGLELIEILRQRAFPVASLRLLASARSAGETLDIQGKPHTIEEATPDAIRDLDLLFGCASADAARELAPLAAERGAYVVDNSSAFRMNPDCPLVVPEVNPEALATLRAKGAGIAANPNCSTIIATVALAPIRRRFGLQRVNIATYQAASGAGKPAMEELESQTRAVLEGDDPEPRIFAEPCAFNVFSHDSPVDPDTGRNVEEQKMIDEMRRIFDDPALRIAATCVRVPVRRAHAEAVTITLTEPAAESDIRAALQDAPGVRIIDDRAGNDFPTPLKASGTDQTLVGRIRPDESQDSIERDGATLHRGYHLFICADQLRKGAALNAVQIAELLIR